MVGRGFFLSKPTQKELGAFNLIKLGGKASGSLYEYAKNPGIYFLYYYIVKLFLLPAPLSSFHRDERGGQIPVSVHQYTP